MPTVLVTGPTVTQNSPFSSLAVAETIASTHFAYPRREDQAELSWLNTKVVYPQMGTHRRHCSTVFHCSVFIFYCL